MAGWAFFPGLGASVWWANAFESCKKNNLALVDTRWRLDTLVF